MNESSLIDCFVSLEKTNENKIRGVKFFDDICVKNGKTIKYPLYILRDKDGRYMTDEKPDSQYRESKIPPNVLLTNFNFVDIESGECVVKEVVDFIKNNETEINMSVSLYLK